MNRISLLLAWIACVGMISPVSVFGERPASGHRIQDVALQAGVFHGQVVDHQGNAVANTRVDFAKQGAAALTTTTDAGGRFQVAGVNGGTYQVRAANNVSICRVWSQQAAPPVATDSMLLVSNASIVRGQCAGCNTGGGYAVNGPVAGGVVQGQPVQGQVVQGPVVDGGYVDPGCSGGVVYDDGCYGAPVAGTHTGGGVLGFISNPWFVGAVVAAAIAIPLAVSDNDTRRAS